MIKHDGSIEELKCFLISVEQQIRTTFVSKHRIYARSDLELQERLDKLSKKLEKDVDKGLIKYYKIIGVCPAPLKSEEDVYV